MSQQGKVASRYARAIFSLSQESAKTKALIAELGSFATVLTGNAELQSVVNSPVFSSSDRRTVIEDLSNRLKISKEVQRVLLVLSDAKRLSVLNEIIDNLRLLILESLNIMPLTVEAAHPLGRYEQEKLEKKFKQILGRSVEASYKLDPALLGGLRVTAAGKTYDGAIATKLELLSEQLLEGSI